MKQPIRYFAIGLFTASLLLLISLSFFDEQESETKNNSVDEMIENLKAEGYHVLTESEYIKVSVKDEKSEGNSVDKSEEKPQGEKQSDTTDPDKQGEAADEEDSSDEDTNINTYTLHVEPNMLGPTVSQLLFDNKIIEDAEEFNRYLELEGYAPYIQLGEHKLSSEMDNHEIAEAITN